MTDPQQYLYRMGGFLLAVIILVIVLYDGVWNAFVANPGLNGLILGVFFLGVAYIFRIVIMLVRDVNWLGDYRSGVATTAQSQMLAPMAMMLGQRSETLSLSATSMRSLLDGISARLDESRDLSRYFIGLLIFLGLLGTFWGLLQTIGGVSDVIEALSVDEQTRGNEIFADLKLGLQSPLDGMGTAFSSSLFGLAGSLVLGFLELQAGQAQNRFYNDLEDWLSGQTQLTSAAMSTETDTAIPSYVQGLLAQSAESLEALQRTLQRSEETRIRANESVSRLTERVTSLTQHMQQQQTVVTRLAESQMQLTPLLSKLEEDLTRVNVNQELYERLQEHLRNIDIQMGSLLEETTRGRHEMVEQLRAEFRLLNRTIAAATDQES